MLSDALEVILWSLIRFLYQMCILMNIQSTTFEIGQFQLHINFIQNPIFLSKSFRWFCWKKFVNFYLFKILKLMDRQCLGCYQSNWSSHYDWSHINHCTDDESVIKYQNWWDKVNIKFVPYKSDCSWMGDSNWLNQEEDESDPNNQLCLAPNGTISKYIEKTGVVSLDSDVNNDDSSHNTAEVEKEVKLRWSYDYEIHTITEESEQVTQSDIKICTPSSFSSKPITPNKRYSNGNDVTSKQLNYQITQNLFVNSISKEERIWAESLAEKLITNQNANLAKEKHIFDIVEEDYANASMQSITDKLKIILKNASKSKKKDVSEPQTSFAKSQVLSNIQNHVK